MLGIFVERASGMKYPDFLRERIFDPLGMLDTGFIVPPEKHARFAPLQSLGLVPACGSHRRSQSRTTRPRQAGCIRRPTIT